MKIGFYPKLAWSNIKKNAKTYVPYILTCIGCVMTMYIILAMSLEPKMSTISGGAVTAAYLSVGVVIIGIFSAIFLFYTNSFLMKRRKKEFGLYNVLGMGKRHIVRGVFFETLFIAILSIAVGIGLGAVLSKLMMLLMLKLVGVETVFSMAFSVEGAVNTAIVFSLIFLLNLLGNVIRISRNKTIDLLYGDKHGEKEPKTNIPLAVIGLAGLVGGYLLALSVKNPMEALALFFIAVIMVIIGTYALITAGSTVILKLLKKNKGYYYKPNHFISVSGMLYRMKQNAAGISSICILSTMVLVTISTTACLYFGLESSVNDRVNRDVMFAAYTGDQEEMEEYPKILKAAQEKTGYTVKDLFAAPIQTYNMVTQGDGYGVSETSQQFEPITFLTEKEYNGLLKTPVTLEENQVIMDLGEDYRTGSISLGDKSFDCVPGSSEADLTEVLNYNKSAYSVGGDNLAVVVKDQQVIKSIFGDFTKDNNEYIMGFNTDSPEAADEMAMAFNNGLMEYKKSQSEDASQDVWLSYTAFTRDSMLKDLRSYFGSFLFLGIFLGALFLMATVLIMYYKQISEGYDDKQRFHIMEKVGMNQREIRKTIQSQVLMVFFIPLLFAIIHVAFATKMISLILIGFGITSIMVLITYTVASVVIFTLIYLVSYGFTARSYYKIVR